MSSAPNPQGEQADPVTTLIGLLAKSSAQTWNSPDGLAHITVTVNGRREHYPVDGSDLRSLLRIWFFRSQKRPVPNAALEHVVHLLQAKADSETRVHEPHVRFAVVEDTIYVDVGDAERTVVKVTASGSRVLDPGECPVRFVRPRGALPLPVPNLDAGPEALLAIRDTFRLQQDAFVLVVAFLVGCANPERVYPLLVLRGGQGTGKSTLAKAVRRLVDPHTVPLATPPTSERDLMVVAMGMHLLAFDNLSGLKEWLSDAFCRLSTGGGLQTRSLFTNRGVERFSKTAPVLLNGIDEVTARNDLASRAIEVELRPVPPEHRRPLSEIEREFDRVHADVLGALCNAWSTALQRRGRVRLEENPRMLDFALWNKAAEPALPFSPGEFERTYLAGLTAAAESNVENDPVASAVAAFMADRERWEGGVKDLIAALHRANLMGDLVRVSARKFASDLVRAAPALDRVGISVHVDRARKDPKTRRQIYVLTRDGGGE
jgi:hypothetical protein